MERVEQMLVATDFTGSRLTLADRNRTLEFVERSAYWGPGCRAGALVRFHSSKGWSDDRGANFHYRFLA
ncbi:hypothetical protein XH83_27200 [Bradyrhizobium sp. CCBAU 53351]|nr:hypothetical protein XH83_27200 [Bradyrhizobium sp. CCBAU 53351]